MKKCKNCNIEISGSQERCPLCNQELKGKNSNSVFPKINLQKENVLKKILLLVSLTVAILSLFLEFYTAKRIFISKFIVFGLITNYILIVFILNNYKNILKKTNKYFVTIILLLIGWYFITKSLIITTYFIPILCIVIYGFNSIIMLVYKDSYVFQYIKTMVLDSIIGIVPLIFFLLNLTTTNLPSFISLIINAIIFLGLLIFCFDKVIEELKKTFNI